MRFEARQYAKATLPMLAILCAVLSAVCGVLGLLSLWLGVIGFDSVDHPRRTNTLPQEGTVVRTERWIGLKSGYFVVRSESQLYTTRWGNFPAPMPQEYLGGLVKWTDHRLPSMTLVEFRLSVWAAMVIFGVYPAIGLIHASRRRRRRYRNRHGLCPKCGYNLTGNVSGRCPECGAQCSPKSTGPNAVRGG